MAPHSSLLPRKSHGWRSLVGCSPWGCEESDTTKATQQQQKQSSTLGFLGVAGGKESACQCRRHIKTEFHPWIWKIPWRRAWQPTPVFLPRESHGQRSLAGYGLQGHKEPDMTEITCTQTHYQLYIPKFKQLRLCVIGRGIDT